MPIGAAMFSSDLQDWNTPEIVLERVRRVAPIGLDPCSNERSIVGAAVEWRLPRGEDGLARPWGGHGLVFVNPEYGRALLRWARKIATEAQLGVEIVVLVPHRTDTEWYATIAPVAAAKCEWRGRLHHPRGVVESAQASLFPSVVPDLVEDDHGPAAFPSVLLYFGERAQSFAEAMDGAGEIWRRW